MEKEYLYAVAHQSELNETIRDISDKAQLSEGYEDALAYYSYRN